MTQKKRKADSGKVIGETTALRWEPTHVTKPSPRVVPLQGPDCLVTELSILTPTEVIAKAALYCRMLLRNSLEE